MAILYQGQLNFGNKCLDHQGNPNAVPVLATPNGSPSQFWILYDTADGNILQADSLGWMALRTDNLTIEAAWNNPSAPQHWTLRADGQLQAEAGPNILQPTSNGASVQLSPEAGWLFSAQPAESLPILGVFSPWADGPPAGDNFPNWESALGLPANSIQDMGHGMAFQGSWSNYDASAASVVSMWQNEGRGDGLVQCTLPPFPDSVSGTLTAAAAGTYNSHYTALAQVMVNAGYTKVLFRPIWEFGGGWYPWGWSSGQQNQSTYVADYKGAFQQMVTTIRAVMPNAIFCFCADDGKGMSNWTDCFPGASYCDIVGIDWYLNNDGNTITDQATSWAANPAPGISASQALAIANQKHWGIFETAVGRVNVAGQVGDSAYVIQQLALACQSFMQQAATAGYAGKAYLGYWNNGDPQNGYDAGNMYQPGEPNNGILLPNAWGQFITAFPNGFHA